MLVAPSFSAPMICIIAKRMAAMRITVLSVCNAPRLEAITRFAFEHLHQLVSVACLNFLVRMPSHRLLALRADKQLDGIAHWATPLFAGVAVLSDAQHNPRSM